MISVAELFRNKFQHPLILLFATFGAFLILLGLAKTLDVPYLKGINIDPNFQVAAMTIGFAFILLAVLIIYRPPRGWAVKDPASYKGDAGNSKPVESEILQTPSVNGSDVLQEVPVDLTKPYIVRRGQLSRTQKQILGLMETEKKLPLRVIKKEFGFENSAEVYYRLEQLRLLGFVEKEKIEDGSDSAIMVYRLTGSYSGQLGDGGSEQTFTLHTGKIKPLY